VIGQVEAVTRFAIYGRTRSKAGRRPTPRGRGLPYGGRLALESCRQGQDSMPDELTHFDEEGASRMVDVGAKAVTSRVARASGRVVMQPETLARIQQRGFGKGDVLEVARLAGIMAAKRTGELIPLCHPLPLESVTVGFSFPDDRTVAIEAEVHVTAKTGVEMEALTAVSVAALTIYDMCKAIDRGMAIEQIRLEEKAGGKSGHFLREVGAADAVK
jgi:cyclic pyranopterin monophosphate synthase